MSKLLRIVALMAAFTLSGCVVVHGNTETDATALAQSDLAFIGLPAPLNWIVGGFQGTAFKVSPELSLTAAHVAVPLLKDIKAISPQCDAAIFASGGSSNPHKLAFASIGQNVTLYGYSGLTGLPKSGTGTVTRWLVHDHCILGVIEHGGVVSGMSGGPVVDSLTGKTIGVTSAVVAGKDEIVFVPVQAIQNLLNRLHIPYAKH